MERANASLRSSSNARSARPFFVEARGANAAVVLARTDGDQARGFQRTEDPAEVTRVEIEPGAQAPDIAARLADLPEHPRLSERAIPREVVVAECPDLLGDGPVEPPDLGDLGGIHTSDFSQR